MSENSKTATKITPSEDYNQAVRRLSNYLKVEEMLRREWSKENWFHVGGKFYSIYRVLMPVLSFIGWLLAALYAAIRRTQSITDLYITESQITRNYIYYIAVMACIVASIIAVIMLIRKKYFGSSAALLICNSIIFVHVLTQINAIAIDNTAQGAMFTYKDVCIALLCFFAVLILYSAIIIIIALRDKRLHKKLVESTVTKIIAGTKGITDTSDYCRLIDEWLNHKREKENQNN